jgi:hypothetical protein
MEQTTTRRKATRQKAKIKLGLSAVSGAGKTYTSLLIAKGLAKGDLSKVTIVDTENNSADLYSHLGPYNVIPLSAPFSPEKYIAAIKECEEAGDEVIIVDSITHEWEGKGGCLEIHSSMTGNSYTNWALVTPRHQNFINAILQSKCHVITTVRRKQDYEMSKNENGKTKVEKVGLKEITREGFEYEVTTNLELDIKHNATASKDRTGLFMGQPPFIPDESTGKKILAWCESGAEVITPTVQLMAPPTQPIAPAKKEEPTNQQLINSAKVELDLATTLAELQESWTKIPKPIQAVPVIKELKDALKKKLTPKQQ